MNPRLSGAPIEPRAGVCEWADADGTPRLTYWSCTQFPHGARDGLASGLGVDTDQVHVITPDVGGGFGAKNGQYVEDLVVAELARTLDRPMRWAETRSESMTNLAHARSVENRVKLGGTSDGDIQAYECHMIQDVATGNYDIPKVAFSAESVVTTTTPIGAYRGAGRPEATIALERIIDVFANEIGLDPIELRRRNLFAPDAFPVATPTGADYAALRAEQERRRNDPSAKLLGLGWCVYVEIANPMGAGEFGSVQVRPDGSAVVLTGSSAHGQGHHTAFAQVAADVTGIPFDRIEVRHGDTDEVKRGGGTGEPPPSPSSGARSPAGPKRNAAASSSPKPTSRPRPPPSPSVCTSPSSRSTGTPAKSCPFATSPATTPAPSSTRPSSKDRSTAASAAASATPSWRSSSTTRTATR